MGIGGNFTRLADARREGSYSVKCRGIVVTYSFTVLASLGLNTYPREKGGEGWSGARRRNAPPRSFDFLRISRTEQYF